MQTLGNLQRIRSLVLSALFTVLIIMGTLLKIPFFFGIPLTFQVPVIQIAALGLPKPYGIFAVANYLFLGAVGLPVFSFGGGIHLFFEKTGGYLVGFLIATVVLQIFRDFFLSKPIITLIGLFLHTLVIFTLGILWHSYVDQLGVTKLIFAMQPFLLWLC